VIVLDTSGLVAALDRGEAAHVEARRIIEASDAPLVLSPFVLTEVDYLLTRHVGIEAALELLADVEAGAYALAPFVSADVGAARKVAARYRDLAIGLAEASLVVLAGRHRTDAVLTLDERHFRALRTPDGRPFRLLPIDA
jgi:predicted nucleic acid-binding protein